MEKLITLMSLTVTALLVVSCEYESPLTKEHNTPVDSSILGLWIEDQDPGEQPGSDERMMVLKYSDTEYLIHYPTGKDGIYYRGYPIKIGGISCVQLEIVGTEDGPLDNNEKDLFHVASYEFKQGLLEVKLLNTDLVDDDLKDAGALRKAFLENIDNKELFEDPSRFRKEEI
jgi:hypothetical protein